MSANDGGPVYPFTKWNSHGTHCHTSPGLSILDHFAGLAMQAIGINETVRNSIALKAHVENVKAESLIAEESYLVAEAMLAERAKRMQPADLTDLPFGGAK